MKLNEIKRLAENSEDQDIISWLNSHCQVGNNLASNSMNKIEINPLTQSLKFHGDLVLSGVQTEKLPYKIESVDGNFMIFACYKLKTLENTPDKIKGKYSINSCRSITNLEHVSLSGALQLSIDRCTSLKDFSGLSAHDFDGEVKISDSGITDFKGLDVTGITSLQVGECDNLESFNGLKTAFVHNVYVKNCASFKTLEGCPPKVKDSVSVIACPIFNVDEHVPSYVGATVSLDAEMHSLEELTNVLTHAVTIRFNPQKWPQTGYLSAFSVEGLKMLASYNGQPCPEEMEEPMKIIQRNLIKKASVFDCQNEMIDAGYEIYC